MGWREEIASALGEWIAVEGGVGKQPRWQLVGRAARSGDPGGYVVDLRGSDIGPEQLDSLRLAGAGSDGIETEGFAVSEAVQNGSLLTLRVPEFAEIDDPHLWMLKQPPTFLIEALRDGIAGLGEHPLATALATAMIGGRSAHAVDPPGFHPAQADAYRACLGEGVHLVWGPPGTGKTTVLKRAIGDLIGPGAARPAGVGDEHRRGQRSGSGWCGRSAMSPVTSSGWGHHTCARWPTTLPSPCP
ncbi:Part of AAA domain-containing protein [Streptomyces sp. Ncost-T6T-2b]|nr:Part of AAA domain-containing protein [Streptomyces sp. Ncost-T6T-2b]